MNNIKSAITVLSCQGNGKKAAKKFTMGNDGVISKQSFSAGKFFKYEEITVSNLEELGAVIEGLSNERKKFVIRGQIKQNMPEIVRRKIHDPDAAFDPVSRPYVMLDIDKLPCPAYLDAARNPEEIIRWVLATLPQPFQDVSCYYKFSASQSVPYKEAGCESHVSIHLWFWCGRPVLDAEWKRYFKSVSSSVDASLFSPVQIHFTANPIFIGMDDPLPRRSGLYKGRKDIVAVPEIGTSLEQCSHKRRHKQPVVSEENYNHAIEFLAPYYAQGRRNRLCGALAATLYRGGWEPESIADFIHELAEKCGDEEAADRYDNALRICNAVESNLPAQGIPTLKNEFKIERLDEILNLLDVGKPDIAASISKLSNQSTVEEIKNSLRALLSLPDAEQEFHLDEISQRTSSKKATLRSLLKEVNTENKDVGPSDYADILMETLLEIEYQRGQHLLHTSDRSYWLYNGRFWEAIPVQQIKKALLPHARQLIAELEDGSVPTFNNAVLNILEGRVYRENDPLGRLNQDPPMVINCKNGELWFDDNGDYELRPHRSDSYLRYCLDIAYDPAATSPMFDDAVREIFSNSSDPDDMFRHFMELAGYVCQPWRKLAIIVLLYGGGSNGKTSLVKIMRRMLGENTVMSDRIGDIEGNVFKIGDLDGKLMLLDDDVDGGTCLPDGFLKTISEEKALRGQHKYKSPFDFICRAVPVMLANDYPVTRDLSEGMRRRLLIIPFNRTFEPHEMKVDLFDNIWEQEASGILNHTVAGFQRLKKRKRFMPPQDCLNAKDEWIARANILTAFIRERCELGERYRVHLGDFYDAFLEYCREDGVKNTQTRRGVESRLEGLKFRIGELNGKKAVWGLKLSLSASMSGKGRPDIEI